MTKWQRFGDDTWVNVDQVEVIRVEEQEDGRWQLIAAFASGRSYPVGSHDDRQLLADCTDALVRGEVSEHLRAWVNETAPEPTNGTTDAETNLARGRWWRFRRSHREGENSPVGPRPATNPS